MSTGVPEETAPLVQSITLVLVDIVIRLLAGPLTVSGRVCLTWSWKPAYWWLHSFLGLMDLC